MKIWEIFPRMAQSIERSHTMAGGSFFGHDFDHALRVANYATLISPNYETARLAGAAGLCHNADRILQHIRNVGPYGDIPDSDVRDLVNSWLDEESDISKIDRKIILDAVLKHSKKNGPDDHPVLAALMDADRLVNIEADLITREGQFLPNMRVIDPVNLLDDKTANFRSPGSILRHIQELLDWGIEGGDVGIRLEKAKKIAKPRLDFFRLFLATVIEQRKEAGLIPYPEITSRKKS